MLCRKMKDRNITKDGYLSVLGLVTAAAAEGSSLVPPASWLEGLIKGMARVMPDMEGSDVIVLLSSLRNGGLQVRCMAAWLHAVPFVQSLFSCVFCSG